MSRDFVAKITRFPGNGVSVFSTRESDGLFAMRISVIFGLRIPGLFVEWIPGLLAVHMPLLFTSWWLAFCGADATAFP